MRMGAFIPIRLDSERLPAKSLKPAAGRPILYHLLDRAAACPLITDVKDIVICTTPDAVDDPLVDAVEAYGASVFRGDKDDLIKRFKDAKDAFGFDYVLQIDGDDPLVDPDYMGMTLQALIDDPSLDACTTVGLPFGINVKSFTANAMDKVFAAYKSHANDTGFALYFIQSDLCVCKKIAPVQFDHVLDEARLTLDYVEDLTVFQKILDALYKPGPPASIADINAFLRAHPEIMAINNGLQESYMERSRAKVDLEYVDPDGAVRRIDY